MTRLKSKDKWYPLHVISDTRARMRVRGREKTMVRVDKLVNKTMYRDELLE